MEHPVRHVILSGCSGGGKSTLLAALAAAGHATVAEPGRRVLAAGGPAPWDDLRGFLEACLALAQSDLAAAKAEIAAGRGPVIFDRGAFDALSGMVHLGMWPRADLAVAPRYDGPVFLAPPWRAIFAPDSERRQDFDAAVAEYLRLAEDFPAAGYRVEILPRAPVADRLAWVVARIGAPSGAGLGKEVAS